MEKAKQDKKEAIDKYNAFLQQQVLNKQREIHEHEYQARKMREMEEENNMRKTQEPIYEVSSPKLLSSGMPSVGPSSSNPTIPSAKGNMSASNSSSGSSSDSNKSTVSASNVSMVSQENNPSSNGGGVDKSNSGSESSESSI